jgi:hypothetical protein
MPAGMSELAAFGGFAGLVPGATTALFAPADPFGVVPTSASAATESSRDGAAAGSTWDLGMAGVSMPGAFGAANGGAAGKAGVSGAPGLSTEVSVPADSFDADELDSTFRIEKTTIPTMAPMVT